MIVHEIKTKIKILNVRVFFKKNTLKFEMLFFGGGGVLPKYIVQYFQAAWENI